MSNESYFMSKVLTDVIDSILVGDWESYDTKDGRKYYIMGWNAYRKETGVIVEGNTDKRQLKWTPSASVDSYIRSLDARPIKDDYLNRAEKRLQDVGIPDTHMASMILSQLLGRSSSTSKTTDNNSDSDPYDLFTEEQIEAVYDWLDARLRPILETVDPDRNIKPGGLDEDRQKLYLREISYKYPMILKKNERLTPLPFQDKLLNEAIRCWLYGFYRATIILAAAALEALLKKTTGMDRFEKYNKLVDNSSELDILSGPYISMAKEVFSRRNKIAHAAVNPTSQDAEDTLFTVRGIMKFIHERS